MRTLLAYLLMIVMLSSTALANLCQLACCSVVPSHVLHAPQVKVSMSMHHCDHEGTAAKQSVKKISKLPMAPCNVGAPATIVAGRTESGVETLSQVRDWIIVPGVAPHLYSSARTVRPIPIFVIPLALSEAASSLRI